MEKRNQERDNQILDKLYEIFRRYKEGKTTKNEQEIIEKASRIINNGEHRRITDKQIRQHTNNLYRIIARQIGFEPMDENLLIPVSTTGKKPVFALHRAVRYAVAASVIALLSVGVYFTYNAMNQNEANYALQLSDVVIQNTGREIKTAFLPDGTEIKLNTASSISYNKADFGKKNRKVSLSGEAFFEVAKDRSKPFLISSKNLTVYVTGTAFTVTAYTEMNATKVWVKSGQVQVLKDQEILAKLTPNDKLVYNDKKNAFEQTEENWSNGAEWINGKLVFDNAGADELKLRLEHFFDIKVEIREDALQYAGSIKATFLREDGLENVMQAISSVCGVNYEIDGSHLLITPEK